ncbi:inactive protein RESTRICTED TEV MOVEMENT 2 [Salvia miltiorrhiza]|uniref:inactive protein RESTRICTED TEV MOVEMENT 2 n=1 Tax=Salvia miltiorrhiza TaxID=226208 RepID=UPI0025AC3C37|nr:inactive protein RESTRICTED TEV MOVEMENT 2 [Salvia miltiorrhiza]
MVMRSRGGGGAGSRRTTRSGVVRSVYEDFKPVSEWQQDDESHILNIYLPGFMKEQIKVSMEGRNTIRVRGERLVAGNKWSRFLEDFQVPENGEMNSARAKFRGGILSITVPREKVGKEDALPTETRGVDDIRKQPTPQKLSGDPEMKRGQDGNQKQPIPQHEASPAVGTSQSAEEKRLEPLKASAEHNHRHDLELTSTRNVVSQDIEKKESSDKSLLDPKNAHDRDGDQKGRSFTPMRITGNVITQNDVRIESSETKEKHVASEKPDDKTKEKVHKEGKEAMRSSELPEAETAKTMKMENNGATGMPAKHADNKELYRASKKTKHKKEMKGLTELNEERQLLVNMGAAMLVIVGLAAYVTYNFLSAKDNN